MTLNYDEKGKRYGKRKRFKFIKEGGDTRNRNHQFFISCIFIFQCILLFHKPSSSSPSSSPSAAWSGSHSVLGVLPYFWIFSSSSPSTGCMSKSPLSVFSSGRPSVSVLLRCCVCLKRYLDKFKRNNSHFYLIVFIDVAILAESTSIEFFVWAKPWFFSSSITMIAIWAHSFSVMLPFLMPTAVHFFSIFWKKWHEKDEK